jgi:hypothetical protein
LRNLQECRWDKLVPPEQAESLVDFVTRACLTPGRDIVLLRFTMEGEPDTLWAVYRILSASAEQAQLTLEALFKPNQARGGNPPDGFEAEPFFAVSPRRERRKPWNLRKVA